MMKKLQTDIHLRLSMQCTPLQNQVNHISIFLLKFSFSKSKNLISVIPIDPGCSFDNSNS